MEIKRYWMWRFYFEGYGIIEKGYFDDYGNGLERNYWDMFQVPWNNVYKEKNELAYMDKEIL
jgi:hypothetical protein